MGAQVVESHLFERHRFRTPAYGRSNVPSNSLLDSPGVWESAGQAYLHEVLVTRTGIAATLAIIYAQARLCPPLKPQQCCLICVSYI